jgi:hypothetical protein
MNGRRENQQNHPILKQEFWNLPKDYYDGKKENVGNGFEKSAIAENEPKERDESEDYEKLEAQ